MRMFQSVSGHSSELVAWATMCPQQCVLVYQVAKSLKDSSRPTVSLLYLEFNKPNKQKVSKINLV